MAENDFNELLGIIQSQLRDIGLVDIANLSNYENELEEKRLPDARFLVISMLKALDRHFAVHSQNTVDEALREIRAMVEEGDGPRYAQVITDPERARVEGKKEEEIIYGEQAIVEVRKELHDLIALLLESDLGRAPD